MRSIGEMARQGGPSVSALRFYARAGVLVPAWMDPVSGCRWWGPGQLAEARLPARLRRAGLPLADIRLVLADIRLVLAGRSARTPTWCGGCWRLTCAVSSAGCPTRAPSSPRSEHSSTTGRTP